MVKSTHPEDEVVIQRSLLVLMIQRRKREVPGGQRRGDLDLVKEGTILQDAIIQKLIERHQVQFQIGTLLHLLIWLNQKLVSIPAYMKSESFQESLFKNLVILGA